MCSTIDQEVFEKFKRGDELAFSAIHKFYYETLFYFCLMNYEVSNFIIDESIAHAFVNLWNNKEKILNKEHLKNFLYRTSRNKVLDYLTNKKNKLEIPFSYFFKSDKKKEKIKYLGDNDMNLFEVREEEILKGRILQFIAENINKIPPGEQKVYKGLFIEGKTTKDLSEELNVTRSTILNQKSDLKFRLRKMINKFLY